MDETPTQRARRLRSDATRAERALWHYLRSRKVLGARFRRQHNLGNFFADFCCIEDRLIVEIDGSSHEQPGAQEKDRFRTDMLRNEGYQVIRFSDADVMLDSDRVLKEIARALKQQRARIRRRKVDAARGAC